MNLIRDWAGRNDGPRYQTMAQQGLASPPDAVGGGGVSAAAGCAVDMVRRQIRPMDRTLPPALLHIQSKFTKSISIHVSPICTADVRAMPT